MSEPRSGLGRQAVLFIRFDGVEALATERGAEAARGLLAATQGMTARRVEENDGELVETIGSEQLCLFPSPDLALSMACQTLGQLGPAGSLVPRIGVHYGQVYRNAEGIFGDAVNTAARILGETGPAQALLSRDAVLALHEASKQLVRLWDRVELKGKAEPLRVFEAMWKPEDLNSTAIAAEMINTGYLRQLSAEVLELLVAGEVHRITPAMVPLTIGRGLDCDISTQAATASRVHASIDHRRGKFVLEDRSTNGTHVWRSDGSTTMLKREDAVLTGEGRIGLGQAVDDTTQPTSPALVRFRCR